MKIGAVNPNQGENDLKIFHTIEQFESSQREEGSFSHKWSDIPPIKHGTMELIFYPIGAKNNTSHQSKRKEGW